MQSSASSRTLRSARLVFSWLCCDMNTVEKRKNESRRGTRIKPTRPRVGGKTRRVRFSASSGQFFFPGLDNDRVLSSPQKLSLVGAKLFDPAGYKKNSPLAPRSRRFCSGSVRSQSDSPGFTTQRKGTQCPHPRNHPAKSPSIPSPPLSGETSTRRESRSLPPLSSAPTETSRATGKARTASASMRFCCLRRSPTSPIQNWSICGHPVRPTGRTDRRTEARRSSECLAFRVAHQYQPPAVFLPVRLAAPFECFSSTSQYSATEILRQILRQRKSVDVNQQSRFTHIPERSAGRTCALAYANAVRFAMRRTGACHAAGQKKDAPRVVCRPRRSASGKEGRA